MHKKPVVAKKAQATINRTQVWLTCGSEARRGSKPIEIGLCLDVRVFRSRVALGTIRTHDSPDEVQVRSPEEGDRNAEAVREEEEGVVQGGFGYSLGGDQGDHEEYSDVEHVLGCVERQ